MHHFSCALAFALVLSACGSSSSPPDAAMPVADAFVAPDTNVMIDANVMRFPASCDPQTFVLTSDGTSYTFGGTERDPVLTLCQGVTYTFDLSSVLAAHPLEIMAGGTRIFGVQGGATHTYQVPTAAPFPTTYDCMIHGFGNTITVVAP